MSSNRPRGSQTDVSKREGVRCLWTANPSSFLEPSEPLRLGEPPPHPRQASSIS